jgi:hypothetical protein
MHFENYVLTLRTPIRDYSHDFFMDAWHFFNKKADYLKKIKSIILKLNMWSYGDFIWKPI